MASRYYSNKQIDRIIAAGGGLKNAALRPNLWRELEGLALAYEIPIYIAPPGRVRSSADKIAKQAKRLAHLLDELGADDETSGLVAGSLAGLVSAGADEPASFGLSLDTSGLPILFSSGERVSYAVVGNTLTASTSADTVFTLRVKADGSWSFNLQNQLDHVDDGANDENLALRTNQAGTTSVKVIDFSSIVEVIDADGDTLAPLLVDDFTVSVEDDARDPLSGIIRYRLEQGFAERLGLSGVDEASREIKAYKDRTQLLQEIAGTIRDKAQEELEQNKVSKGKAVREPNYYRHWLVWRLGIIYRAYFGKRPGLSWKDKLDSHGGPFLEFLNECLQPRRINLKPSGIAEMWRQNIYRKERQKRSAFGKPVQKNI